jgi:hypothetical protein
MRQRPVRPGLCNLLDLETGGRRLPLLPPLLQLPPCRLLRRCHFRYRANAQGELGFGLNLAL